jgi:catechol 2,3-dioxygenase-like lactoylglutathione lyase family enzyme
MRVAACELLLTLSVDGGARLLRRAMEGTEMTDMTNTMKLNHLSFPSTDVAATAAFFEKHLGFAIDIKMERAFILKRPGFDVVIEKAADPAQQWPKNFHVGFELQSFADVLTLHDRFKADGVDMETGIFNNDRGSRFFCRAPGGVMFEINTRADAAPEFRGTFNN